MKNFWYIERSVKESVDKVYRLDIESIQKQLEMFAQSLRKYVTQNLAAFYA